MTPAEHGRARLAVSASQLRDFARCERSWFLAYVAKAPDDDSAGGQYLLQGDLFDEAVQLYSSRMAYDVATLAGNVRRKPGLRGAALAAAPAKWLELAERAQRMLQAAAPLLPPTKTARIQYRYRVPVAGYDAAGGVVVTGTADLRLPGLVWDTKSTSDRGPGRGAGADRPAYALVAGDDSAAAAGPLLRDDVQAALYAWCEFALDPLRLSVVATWVYVSKPATAAPAAWAVSHTFLRPATLAWFDSHVRPLVDGMLVLLDTSEIVLAPEEARANHEGCSRCFRRNACSPFTGAQAASATANQEKQGAIVPMPIDFVAVRAAQAARRATGGAPPGPLVAAVETAAADELETRLAASLLPPATTAEAAAVAGGTQDDRRADVPVVAVFDGYHVQHVAVNRPDAPPNPHAPAAGAVVETTGEDVATTGAVVDPTAVASAEPARRGRGRPRKTQTQTQTQSPAGAGGAGGATPPVEAVQEAVPVAASLVTDDVILLEELATYAQRIVDGCNGLLRARLPGGRL